jgi:hypothetical protein
MELKELVGEHVLSGVDMDNSKVKMWGENFEDCEVIRFVLDGKTYTATEDPEDGYRSCMKDIVVSEEVVSNSFFGVDVVASMRENEPCEVNDVLVLTDTKTGKIVLEVGTENTDDYYPCWVANFVPENMAINQNR